MTAAVVVAIAVASVDVAVSRAKKVCRLRSSQVSFIYLANCKLRSEQEANFFPAADEFSPSFCLSSDSRFQGRNLI